MLEKVIEARLRKEVQKRGGMCMKFVSPGFSGVPDRLCIIDGHVFFVETKRPGEKMRALQERRKEQIEAQGVKVFCIDSIGQIKEVLDEIHAS